MTASAKKTLGLAMSGSGDRTSFYIGFLEELDKAGIKLDYISACSGGSLVAAAYACGGLKQLKNLMDEFDNERMKSLIKRTTASQGGLYSLEPAEEELRKITGGKTFEEIYPKMSFSAVDIENGELVYLCMGDIAHAALVSCALPGLFEPVKWGGRTLVDGGILVMVPSEPLALANIDIKVGINMRGTKHIFTDRQMNFKKAFNFLRKILLIDFIEDMLSVWFKSEPHEGELKNPHLFSVVGKSLDLAIRASQSNLSPQPDCDLTILPTIPRLKQKNFGPETVLKYYEAGRQAALENIPKISKLIE